MILSYVRTVVLYLVLIAVIRLMGKRQIGEMEPSEFVVTMLVANLAAIPMQDGGIPLFSGMVPILTVLGVELVLSWWMLRSTAIRRLLCGKPAILIENGKIRQQVLRHTRITLDELMEHLRSKDVLDPRKVQFAILETNGTLSVFPYPESKPPTAKDAGIQPDKQHLPITLVMDGTLMQDNLALSGKSTDWLDKVLESHGARVENTFLLMLSGKDDVHWIGKEHK